MYVYVWVTWCGPCRAEILSLKATEEKYQGKNIEFVSISSDVAKDHDKWKNFVTDKSLGGVQLLPTKIGIQISLKVMAFMVFQDLF